MNENISFRRLKTVIKTKGLTLAELAEKCDNPASGISSICTGKRIPKTDLLAKMCSVLKVYPSEIVSFDGVNVNEKYFTNDKREPLPESFDGVLTYKPLWVFLTEYLDNVNKERQDGEPLKTVNDLFNQIEPPRKVNGVNELDYSYLEKARAARFGEGYKAGEYRRTDYSKGLPAPTRTKLRNDRPLNLSVIYEICKKLGCTVDFVMSYK
jgi:transcriptional regulator with XRE-family HTH domain